MVQSKASRSSRADSGASAGSGKASARESAKKRAAGASPPPPHPPPKKAARGAATAAGAGASSRESRQASRSEQRSSTAPSSTPASSSRLGAKKPSPSGIEAVNRRLKVYWPGRKLWQDGVVTAYNEQEDTHFVKYDTGEEQWVTLRAKEDNRRLKWVDGAAEQSPVSQPSAAASPAAAGEEDDADKGGAEEQQQRPQHRRSRSGSSVLGSGGGASGAQPRSSSRVAKRSLKRQAQVEEEQQQQQPRRGDDSAAAGEEEEEQGSGLGGQEAPSNGQGGKGPAAAEEGSRDSEGEDRKGEGRDHQGTKANEEDQSPPTASKSAAEQEEVGGGPEEQQDFGEGPSDAAAAPTAAATNDTPLRNAKGELLSPSGETEKELRARAEIAWLRTYEALNKAVRLVKLAREGVRGDVVVPNGNVRPGEPIRSPPSGERSPMLSPTSAARKISARPRKSSEKGEALNHTHQAQTPHDAAQRARISVFWPGNGRYYKALVTGYNREKDMHCIEYDDGEEEWLNLSEEYFNWLGPRSRSAGYSQAQCAAVMSLNPEDVVPPTAELLGASINAAESDGPSGEQAVGWRLAILWEADGSYYEAEILSFKNNKHHVLYADGEDEWVTLSKELKMWRQKGRGSCKPAGLGPGVEAPRGRAAIGWRVGVYWKEDTVFYPGEIRGYDSATGKHHIHYDDNEDEFISLSTEKIKWIVPPDMPERKPALRKRLRATSGRPSKKEALTRGGTSEGDGALGGDYSEAAAPADFPNHAGAADPGQWQPRGTAAPAGSSREPSGKGKGTAAAAAAASFEGSMPQEDPRQRIPGVPAVPSVAPGALIGASSAAALPVKAKRPPPTKLPEGAVCRRIQRAALGTPQGGSGSIASSHLRRLASLLLPQQQQDKAASAPAAGPSCASDEKGFEAFLQVCVLDASKVAPFPSPSGVADSSDGSSSSLSRVSVLGRMLARVGAGQESLKQGLPPGARPCRHAGEQLGKKPPQVLSQPPGNLQAIRVSIPKPQQAIPQKTPSALQQPKREEEALVSPFQTPLGGLPRSPDPLHLPTPTAFTLDASPHAPGSAAAPPQARQRPPQQRCAVKTLPSAAAAAAPTEQREEGVPPH